MSYKEKLKRKMQQEAAVTAEEERLRFEADVKRMQEQRENETKLARETAEKETKRRSLRSEILTTSGVLNEMKNLGNELLEGNVKKWVFGVNESAGEARLVWGSRFLFSSDTLQIDYQRSFFGLGDGKKDCSYIKVTVSAEDLSLNINGINLSQNEWRNRDLVQNVLLEAYRNPQRLAVREYRYSSGSSSSSSSSTSDECCHQ